MMRRILFRPLLYHLVIPLVRVWCFLPRVIHQRQTPMTFSSFSSSSKVVVLGVLPNDYYFGNEPSNPTDLQHKIQQQYNNNKNNSNHYKQNDDPTTTTSSSSATASSSGSSSKTFWKALAILPPLKDWDRLQRARHFARDAIFHEWPPCIRLFHPFESNALEVAQVVEELDIQPFDITLDTWVIVPHLEAMEAEWKNSQVTPFVDEDDASSFLPPTESSLQEKQEREAIRLLIEREERKAREKSLSRKIPTNRSNTTTSSNSFGSTHNNNNNSQKKSPGQIFKEQQQQMQDFGGPCILCLEPNMKSKQLLIELRDELATVLNHPTYSSPSSIYSWTMVETYPDMGYRPLIPIGKFESLQMALDVARRIKGLWGPPLTFQVQDLQVISCQEDSDYEFDKFTTDHLQPPQAPPPQQQHTTKTTTKMTFSTNSKKNSNNNFSYEPHHNTPSEWNKEPWGCNAKIMLMGEEVEQDDILNEEMVEQLVTQGQAGGLDISNDFTILDDEVDMESHENLIELYLNNDDDFDEGFQVIIGRTHFYTGDQRTFKGMPASSVVDSKDRSMGEAYASVSGLARRKSTSTRQGDMWKDGEYGRRDYDFLPYGKAERPKRARKRKQAEDSYYANPVKQENDKNTNKKNNIDNKDTES